MITRDDSVYYYFLYQDERGWFATCNGYRIRPDPGDDIITKTEAIRWLLELSFLVKGGRHVEWLAYHNFMGADPEYSRL